MIRTLFTLAGLTVLPCAAVLAQGSKITRVCIAPTTVEASTYSASDIIVAVRETFAELLAGPTLEVEALRARLQAQVREEARAANCPYLLLTSVKHTRKTGGSSMLGRMAGAAVQQGAASAGAAAGSRVGSIAGSAVAGAASAAAAHNFASDIKVKDEFSLTYSLEAGGTEILNRKEKRKAQSDGEDLLTPSAQKAAEAIVLAVSKRR